VQRGETHRSEEETQIEASGAVLTSVPRFLHQIVSQFLIVDFVHDILEADVGQVQSDALFDDGFDRVDGIVLEVDAVGPCAGGRAARIDVEGRQVLQDLVQRLLLELVLFAQADQLVGAEFAHFGALRDVVALHRLQPIHRVVVHFFGLVVVLVSDRGQLLSAVVSDSSQIFHLTGIALLDAFHLLVAVLTNAMNLPVVVITQLVQLSTLVLFDGFQQVANLLGPRGESFPAAVAAFPPSVPVHDESENLHDQSYEAESENAAKAYDDALNLDLTEGLWSDLNAHESGHVGEGVRCLAGVVAGSTATDVGHLQLTGRKQRSHFGWFLPQWAN